MTSFSFIRSLFAGAALAAGFASAAMAQDAVATTDLNMREGPGTAYAIIGSVPEGAGVDYVGRGCAGSWCNVSYRGVIGWVSASYLDEVGEAPPPVVVQPAPPPVYVQPPVYAPGYGYGYRPGWDRPRPRPPGGWDRPRPPDGGWNRPRPPGDGGWNRPRPPEGGGWQRPPRPPGPGPGIGPRPPGPGPGVGPRPPRPPVGGGGSGGMRPLRPDGVLQAPQQ